MTVMKSSSNGYRVARNWSNNELEKPVLPVDYILLIRSSQPVLNQYLFFFPLMAAAGAAVYFLPDYLFFLGPFMAAIMTGVLILMRIELYLGLKVALRAGHTLNVFYMYGILLIVSLYTNYTIYAGNMEWFEGRKAGDIDFRLR